MASSTDSPGPIGKTVEDCALMLQYIAGKDPYDATTSPQPVPDFTKNLKKGVGGLKIGICYEHIASIEPAAKKFIEMGADVDMAPAMSPEIAVAVYTVVQRSEVSSNLARYDGVRYGSSRETFGEEAKRRIMLGTFTLTKGYADRYYVAAQKVRSLYVKNYQELFSKYDLLISPTSPGYALKLGASMGNPMFGELEDMLVEPSSLAGLPGINIPWHRDPKTNLFLGLNITGNYWAEEKILQAAYAFEQATKL
jgi:aspartyl-tRNA(Asn)/glutamyl-tRNA(Gln) amidotransferase subunit A